MMSFQCTDEVITAMCSTATSKTMCGVSFSWVQYKKRYDGSKLAQVNELDKLACKPILTLCCIRAMKPTAISLYVFVRNLVLLGCYNFGLLSVNSSFGGDTSNLRHTEIHMIGLGSYFCD
jgi:hypothetical protein